NYDDFQLKQIADELTQEIEKVKEVSTTNKIGGRNRQLRVVLDKDKLAASGLDFLGVAEMIKANNQQLNSGSFDNNDTEFLVTTGNFLKSATDVENLVVGVQQHQPIYLKQIAAIYDGPEIPSKYVSFGFGGAGDNASNYPSEYPAVTISVAKRKGADAMKIADLILDKVDDLRSNL